jgi:hypothetical protein
MVIGPLIHDCYEPDLCPHKTHTHTHTKKKEEKKYHHEQQTYTKPISWFILMASRVLA